jgi:osmotically-inducible protein OsmY
MNIAKHFTIVSSLLLVAGCAHEERQARYSEVPPGYDASGTSSSTTYQQTGRSTDAQSSVNSSSTTPSTGLQGQTQNDRALVAQVQQNLSQDNTVSAIMPRVQITAQNGTVTLSGNVSSEQEKQRIETTVKGTGGVASVNNQLQISLSPTSDRPGQGGRLYQDSTTTPPSSTPAPESTPATPEASKASPDLSKSDSPSATTDPSRSEAIKAANEALDSSASSKTDAGLSPTSNSGSTNRIYATTDSTTAATQRSSVQASSEADRSLGQKIQQEIQADANLAAQLSAIKITVVNGKIVLSGAVKSDDQKQSVEKAAQRVTGVSSVDNQLQVSSNPTVSPADSAAPAATPQK